MKGGFFMTYEKILYEKQAGIAFITLNDPTNRNTISGSGVEELGCCLDDCSDDPAVRGGGDSWRWRKFQRRRQY